MVCLMEIPRFTTSLIFLLVLTHYLMMRLFVSAAILTSTVIGDGNCSVDESKLWITSRDFTDKFQKCALSEFGASGPTSSCLRSKFPSLSENCSSCFGNTVQCGRDNCMKECLKSSATPECIDCTVAKGCTSGLASCTGFEQGPPNPTSAVDTKSSSLITSFMAFIVICLF